jgi:hypothetical protein
VYELQHLAKEGDETSLRVDGRSKVIVSCIIMRGLGSFFKIKGFVFIKGDVFADYHSTFLRNIYPIAFCMIVISNKGTQDSSRI